MYVVNYGRTSPVECRLSSSLVLFLISADIDDNVKPFRKLSIEIEHNGHTKK